MFLIVSETVATIVRTISQIVEHLQSLFLGR
jgi:hypothetical protein